MVDPVGRSSSLPPDTNSPREQEVNQYSHATVPVSRPSASEFAGAAAGAKIGLKIGGAKGNGFEIKGEGGVDVFGGPFIESEGDLQVTTTPFNAGGEANGRYYPWDDTGRFSRGEAGGHWEAGRQGASKGASGRVTWDNNPITPEISGRKWDQIGGKYVERTGADNLERDGASGGLHGLIFGTEYDHRFNPEGFRYERNDYFGAGTYWERDVLGLVNYDPPSANVYTTTKLGVGLGRFGLYGSEMEQRRFDSAWSLDLDSQYRGETPGVFDEVAREKAAASHAQLSLPARSADVLRGQGLGTREAYLERIEETVERTNLPADLVVERMHHAVHQAGIALESDPSLSAGEAFAAQPVIDRRASLEMALSSGLSSAAALDVALARSQGDMRPINDVLTSRNLNGTSTPAGFANDAVAFEAFYSEMSGSRPSFDAIAAAGHAHHVGDQRSAGALVTDYRDNGVIDGSNLINVSFGDETYAVLPGGGAQMVAQPDGTMAPVEAMRPETARGLISMIETARKQEHVGKVDIALDVVEEAGRHGVSPEDRRSLYSQVRIGQEAFGDNRNVDALIADSRDNGFIDGSNIPEATVSEQTYAVSTGGGVMYGRTTMTPTELAARAHAHAAFGGDVDADGMAKARADAMAQAQRNGFASKEQLAVDGPAGPVYDAAASAGYASAKGLADNEYAVAMQMQEQMALDEMIAGAKTLDARVDVPLPAFKPLITIPALKPDQPEPASSDGPDMRGDKVAYGRGVVDHGPLDRGPANTAYDNLDDWAADMRDMFSGNGSKVGEAKPNKAEKAEAEKKAEAAKKKADKHEGGESRGQQGPTESEQREFGGSASEYSGSGGLL